MNFDFEISRVDFKYPNFGGLDNLGGIWCLLFLLKM